MAFAFLFPDELFWTSHFNLATEKYYLHSNAHGVIAEAKSPITCINFPKSEHSYGLLGKVCFGKQLKQSEVVCPQKVIPNSVNSL